MEFATINRPLPHAIKTVINAQLPPALNANSLTISSLTFPKLSASPNALQSFTTISTIALAVPLGVLCVANLPITARLAERA